MLVLMLLAIGAISEKAVSLAADRRADEVILDCEETLMQIKTPLSQNEASIPELIGRCQPLQKSDQNLMDFE